MNDSLNMSVSSILQKDGKKLIYVEFSDKSRHAEGRIPDNKITSNQGFSEEEVSALEFYLAANQEQIVAMAKQVNVFDAFMK